VDYRASTESHFPAQIRDCNAAFNYLVAHAVEYGLDPKHPVVGGASAGGHLALLLGLARQKREFGADSSIRPAAILDFFGPADLNQIKADLEQIHSAKGLEVIQDAGTNLFGMPVDQAAELARDASPVIYASADSPPVLILHGANDELVPAAQSRRLHEVLQRAGVRSQLLLLEDAPHDGPLFSTPAVELQVCDFLKTIPQGLATPER